MRKIALLLVLLSYTFSFAQENYKYLIIPSKFSFFKEENKYNLNAMTKFFFEKEGFQVVYESESLPKELAENRCLALYANAIENNSLFVTKINFEIKDCYNKVIFTSDQGTSREKDLKTAYTLVFRQALASMSGKLNFKSSKVSNEIVTSIPQKTDEVIVSNDMKEAIDTGIIVDNNVSNQLFAQPIANGFQLINGEPKVIYKIYKTTSKEIFIATKDNKNGVFFSKNNEWFFEYYVNDKLVTEKVDVKF